MRLTAFAVLVAFATLATTALAAAGALDAKRLALQTSDLPSSAKRMSEKENRAATLPGGQRGQVYTTTFQFPKGRKRERITVVVVTSGSAGTAGRVFDSLVAEAKRETGRTLVRVGALGAAQHVTLTGRVQLAEAGVEAIVRQGAVVWVLDIQTDPLAKEYGLTRAEALAELATYGAKQKRRVDRG